MLTIPERRKTKRENSEAKRMTGRDFAKTPVKKAMIKIRPPRVSPSPTPIAHLILGMFAKRVFLAIVGIAEELGQLTGSGDEAEDVLLVVADLDSVIVDDDRPFEHRWVGFDEFDELADGHLVEVDMVLLDDLRPLGDDVVGAVLAFGDDLFDILGPELAGENVLRFIGDAMVVEVFLDLPARGTRRGGVHLDHTEKVYTAGKRVFIRKPIDSENFFHSSPHRPIMRRLEE